MTSSDDYIQEGFLAQDRGLWCQKLTSLPRKQAFSPALFLDRDGVVVEEVDYLHRAEDIRLIDGAATIIVACNQADIPVVLVTNQSGIGRGLYGWPEFAAVQEKLLQLLSSFGAHIDMVLACAYHSDAKSPYQTTNHSWRKPNPGMLLAAAERMKIKLSDSWIVGDRATDIEAGHAAQLRGGILVLSGHTRQSDAHKVSSAGDNYRVRVAYSLAACPFLIEYMKPANSKAAKPVAAEPQMDRASYNKLKLDERLLRQRLGLPPL